MWVTFTVCHEMHSGVKQREDVGFRQALPHFYAVGVIHWPNSALMVHLYMQLLGKEKDKDVPRAVLLRCWSKKKQCK